MSKLLMEKIAMNRETKYYLQNPSKVGEFDWDQQSMVNAHKAGRSPNGKNLFNVRKMPSDENQNKMSKSMYEMQLNRRADRREDHDGAKKYISPTWNSGGSNDRADRVARINDDRFMSNMQERHAQRASGYRQHILDLQKMQNELPKTMQLDRVPEYDSAPSKALMKLPAESPSKPSKPSKSSKALNRVLEFAKQHKLALGLTGVGLAGAAAGTAAYMHHQKKKREAEKNAFDIIEEAYQEKTAGVYQEIARPLTFKQYKKRNAFIGMGGGASAGGLNGILNIPMQTAVVGKIDDLTSNFKHPVAAALPLDILAATAEVGIPAAAGAGIGRLMSTKKRYEKYLSKAQATYDDGLAYAKKNHLDPEEVFRARLTKEKDPVAR